MTRASGTGEPWQETARISAIQRRTLRILVAAQVIGGIGVGAAASMGALLAESVTHSEALAGLARTSSTLGAAAVGLPLALLAARRGRRSALSLGWALAALGGVVLVVSAATGDIVLLILGMMMFGSGSATNLQSRYAAADLAAPRHRARALALVVWSTTLGAVVGPNLAAPGAEASRLLALPPAVGGFLLGTVGLALAALVLWTTMRPDPLLEARAHEAGPSATPVRTGLRGIGRAELRAVLRSADARFAFAAVVCGHTVMSAVMTMTPVDMTMMGDSLTLVGITISLHVLGMYGFSPGVGWLADRFGRAPVILAGLALLVASTICTGLAGPSLPLTSAGLLLLGLGWSFTLVAGSALLGDSVAPGIRPGVQGLADTAMNVVAAMAAGLSGPVLAHFGFGTLNLLSALLVLPVLALRLARGGTPDPLAAAEPLPAFPYHPDPVATGAVVRSAVECACCGRVRGHLYTGPVHAVRPPRGRLCPWCVADGSAAARFGARFTGVPDDLPAERLPAVTERTPGFGGRRQERWLVHCGDAAAFLGTAGAAELAGLPDALASLRQESAGTEQILDTLTRDGRPTAYLFRCLTCGTHLAYADTD